MPQQHPQTPTTPAPRTRREALAAERAAAAPTASRTRTATITAATQPALRPLPTVATAPATPVRSLRSRVLAAVPITGATAAMALFTAGRSAARAGNDRPRGSRARCRSCHRRAELHRVRVGSRGRPRDGYTITKPAPKPVITKTAPASQAASTGGAPASTKQSVPTTTGGTIVNRHRRHPLARRRNHHRQLTVRPAKRPVCDLLVDSPGRGPYPRRRHPHRSCRCRYCPSVDNAPRVRAVRHHRPSDRRSACVHLVRAHDLRLLAAPPR